MKWKSKDWFLLTSIYISKGTNEDKSGESTRKGKLRKILLLRLRDPEEVILQGSELEGQKSKDVRRNLLTRGMSKFARRKGKEFILKKAYTEWGVDGMNCYANVIFKFHR